MIEEEISHYKAQNSVKDKVIVRLNILTYMTFAESSVTSLSLDGEITSRNVSTKIFGERQAQFSNIIS